jgi:hypothetical protein
MRERALRRPLDLHHELGRRAAEVAVRILNGERPADTATPPIRSVGSVWLLEEPRAKVSSAERMTARAEREVLAANRRGDSSGGLRIDELAAETIPELLCMRALDKTEDVHSV